MASSEPLLPDGWSRPSGFSHGIVASGARTVYVAGQLGRDRTADGQLADGFLAQWDCSLRNVRKVLEAAGGNGSCIVALRIYVTDIDEYRDAPNDALGRSWTTHIGRWYPATTLVEVSRLLHDNALVEIEATAVLDA